MKKDKIFETTVWVSKVQMEQMDTINFPFIEVERRDELDRSALSIRVNRQGYLLLKELLNGVKADDF